MGALHSLQERLKDISDLAEEAAKPGNEVVEVDNSSTPSRPQNKRLLDLDPRSPTENINRTPIVVDKTPMLPPLREAVARSASPVLNDPRSPTADFTRTPINPGLASGTSKQNVRAKQTASSTPESPGAVIDPRSPTVDFTRTPINPCLASGTSKQNARTKQSTTPEAPSAVIDPRSPTVDFTRTPINPCLASATERLSVRGMQSLEAESPTSTATYGSESGIESTEVTPIKGELHFRGIPDELRLESPDSALSVCASNPSDVPALSSETESSPSLSTPSDTDDTTPLVTHNKHTPAAVESTPKLPVSRGRPQALTKLSKLAVEATKLADSQAVTRSPLSSVCNVRVGPGLQQNNNNTVTPLRQKFGGSGGNTAQTGLDKENCIH